MPWMKVRVFRISIINNSWTSSRRVKHKKMLGIRDGGKKDKKQENSRLQIQQVQTADSRGLLRDCEIFVILRISYVSSSNK